MIEFNNPEHMSEIAIASGCTLTRNAQCISRSRGGKLLGGVIFQGYNGASATCHVAGFSHDWINRDILWVSFHYAFVQMGCNVLIGTTPSRNPKTLEFVARLGFKQRLVVPNAYRDCDMVISTMTPDECRWLNLKPRTLRAGSGGGSA